MNEIGEFKDESYFSSIFFNLKKLYKSYFEENEEIDKYIRDKISNNITMKYSYQIRLGLFILILIHIFMALAYNSGKHSDQIISVIAFKGEEGNS